MKKKFLTACEVILVAAIVWGMALTFLCYIATHPH